MAHYVYDFDSTLYETTRVWNRWVEIIKRFGYATPDLTATERAINATPERMFTPRRHAELLGMKPEEIDLAVLEQERDVSALGASLVFSDVVPSLRARHGTHAQSVLTFGDHAYQMEKIRASGIGALIGEIRVAGFDRGKAELLRDLLEESSEPITFIDDHTYHLQSVHDAGLPITLVRMRRPGEPHTPEAHPLDGVAWRVVESLDELGGA